MSQLVMESDDLRYNVNAILAAFHKLFTGETVEMVELHPNTQKFFDEFQPKHDEVRELQFALNFTARKLTLRLESDYIKSSGSYMMQLPIDLTRLPTFGDEFAEGIAPLASRVEKMTVAENAVFRIQEYVTLYGPNFKSPNGWLAFTFLNLPPRANAPSSSTLQ